MHKNGTAILFDLDGTLVDTAPDLIGTLNQILLEEGCAPAPEASIRPIISLGARAMLARGLELAGRKEKTRQVDDLVQRFLSIYGENIARHSRPFPGTLTVLEQLSRQGHSLAICTNKSQKLARQLVNKLAMDHFFAAIIGADSLPVRKPDPGHIWGTIEALEGKRDRAIMVGDSEVDILAAQAAGVPVVAASFGYSPQPVTDFNPDATFSHYDELPPIVAALLG